MDREGLDQFFKSLAKNPEHQAKVKSFGGDADAFAAFIREQGYDISPEELRVYQDKARELLKSRLQKKLDQPDVAKGPGAQAFFALMKLAETDGEVGKRIEALASGTPEELIAYGREKGFLFDEQDMVAIGKEILEPSDELSEEELELAAGGIVDLIALAVFVGIGAGVVIAGGVGVAAGAGAVAGFVLGVTALVK